MSYFGESPTRDTDLNCSNRLMLLIIDLPSLRLKEKILLDCPRYAPDPQLVQQLLQAAKALDENLAGWKDTVPQLWRYTSTNIEYETKTDVYPTHIDIYFDHLVASTWNSWRAYRLYVLAVIKKCTSTLAGNHENHDFKREEFEAVDTIQSLVNDICSSIPFHLGHTINDKDNDSLLYPHAVGSRQGPSTTGALGTFLMKFPLSVAVAMTHVPESQRRWMREYLDL